MVSKELQAKFDKRRAAADVAGGERDDEADNARVLAYLKTKRVSVLQHMHTATADVAAKSEGTKTYGNEDLSQQLAVKDAEIDRLRAELAAKNAEIAELRSQLAGKEAAEREKLQSAKASTIFIYRFPIIFYFNASY